MPKERGGKIGKILVDMGSIAQRDVLAALSDQMGIPLVIVDAPAGAPEIGAHGQRNARPSAWLTPFRRRLSKSALVAVLASGWCA